MYKISTNLRGSKSNLLDGEYLAIHTWKLSKVLGVFSREHWSCKSVPRREKSTYVATLSSQLVVTTVKSAAYVYRFCDTLVTHVDDFTVAVSCFDGQFVADITHLQPHFSISLRTSEISVLGFWRPESRHFELPWLIFHLVTNPFRDHVLTEVICTNHELSCFQSIACCFS